MKVTGVKSIAIKHDKGVSRYNEGNIVPKILLPFVDSRDRKYLTGSDELPKEVDQAEPVTKQSKSNKS